MPSGLTVIPHVALQHPNHHMQLGRYSAGCRIVALALCLLAVLPPTAQAADVFEAPYLYVPPEYAEYFYGDLQTAIRERCRLVGQTPPGAYGWYDAETHLHGGADGWKTDTMVRGKTDARLRYRDANGGGMWSAGEYVWCDTDGDGAYTHGADILLYGAASAANTGQWGKGRGLFFQDANANGQWDANEDVWFDAGTLAGGVQALHYAVTSLIPKFVNHNDHGGNWNGLTRQAQAPAWSEAMLLVDIGAPARILPAQYGLPFVAWAEQQGDILRRLLRTRLYGSMVNSEGKAGYASFTDQSDPPGSWASACAEALAQYQARPWTRPGDRTDESYAYTAKAGNKDSGSITIRRVRCQTQYTVPTTIACVLSFYRFSNLWDGPLFVFDDEGLGMTDDTFWMFHEEPNPSNTSPRLSPYPSLAEGAPPAPPSPGGDTYESRLRGWNSVGADSPPQNYGYAIAKWDVPGGLTPIPPPPTAPWPLTTAETLLNTIPDSNRDDLVDVGVDLASFGPDTGTIAFTPERDQPHGLIPLGVTYNASLPVHAYIAQGGFDAPKNTYLTHADADEDGLHLAYSLHTRARIQAVVINASEHVKRIEVIRPRGNAVTFEFAWDTTAVTFAELGCPIDLDGRPGTNANRTYVLRDTTPTNHTDLAFDLCFDSGIVHRFNGGITAVLDSADRAVSVGPGGSGEVTVDLASNTFASAKFTGSIAWQHGRPHQITYTTRGYPGSVTTTLPYDTAGRVTALTKSIPELSVSCTGNTITHDAGHTVTRTGAIPGTVTLTMAHPDRGTLVESFTFDTHGLVTQHTRAVNGYSATTLYDYQAGAGRYANGASKWAKLAKVEYADGTWARFKYAGDTGWLTKQIRPFADAAPTAADSACRVTEFSYDRALSDPAADAADPKRLAERPRRTVGTTCGIETGCTYIACSNSGVTTAAQQCTQPGAAWAASSNLRSSQRRSSMWWWPDSIQTPTGWRNTSASLSWNGPTAQLVATTSNHLPESTTQSRNAFGFNESHTKTRLGVQLDSTASALGLFGQPVKTTYLDGTVTEYCDLSWSGPGRTIAPDGVTSVFTRDPDGRVRTTHMPELGLTETLNYDALGNVKKHVRTGSTGGHTVSETTETTYDALGRVRERKDAYGTTTYAYAGTTLTVTYPDGRQRVEERYRDGRLKRVSGTAAGTPVEYEYGVDGSTPERRTWTLEKRMNQDGAYSVCTKTFYDMLGRVSAVESLNETGATVTHTTGYHATTGLPVAAQDEVGVRSLTAYNAQYEPELGGLDMDGNGALDPAGNDRMRRSIEGVTNLNFGGNVGAKPAVFNSTAVYATAGNASATPVFTSFASTDGRAWQTTENGRTASGAKVYTGAPGGWTITEIGADGKKTVSTYAQRWLHAVEQSSATGERLGKTLSAYDGLGRIIEESVYDCRTGNRRTTCTTYDAAGRVESVTPPGQGPTSFTYVEHSDRVETTTFADGSILFYEYDAHGRLAHEALVPAETATALPPGIDGYDVFYAYTPSGNLQSLTTIRNGASIATDWVYDAYTDRSIAKFIAGVPVAEWSYRDNGAIESLTDANGITATYAYTPNSGDLESISFSVTRSEAGAPPPNPLRCCDRKRKALAALSVSGRARSRPPNRTRRGTYKKPPRSTQVTTTLQRIPPGRLGGRVAPRSET